MVEDRGLLLRSWRISDVVCFVQVLIDVSFYACLLSFLFIFTSIFVAFYIVNVQFIYFSINETFYQLFDALDFLYLLFKVLYFWIIISELLCFYFVFVSGANAYSFTYLLLLFLIRYLHFYNLEASYLLLRVVTYSTLC